MVAVRTNRRRSIAAFGALAAVGAVAARRQAGSSEGFVAPRAAAPSLRATSVLQRNAGPSGRGSTGEKAPEQPAWASTAAAIAAAGCVAASLLSPSAALAKQGGTGSGSRVNKDPISLLQLALPLEETLGDKPVEPVRTLQKSVEELKANTLLRLYDKVVSNAQDADKLVTQGRKDLLKPVSAQNKAAAEAIADQIDSQLQITAKAIEKGMSADAATEKDAEAAAEVIRTATNCQKLVGDLETLMVPPGYEAPTKPVDVPANLPQLKGRAVVEVVLKRPQGSSEKKYSVDAEILPEAKMKITVDGWSMPVTGGNFVDLVDRGFYNGMKIQRADGFIIQTGDSGDADEHGFRPGPGEKVRRIPLEVGIKGRKEALYGETMDEARLVGKPVKIPFQADGAVSMARSEFDNDSASSQWFMFLFESDMTPGGKNLLDGRYASFGYTTEGLEFIRQIKEGDIIESMKVIEGADKLVRPAA